MHDQTGTIGSPLQPQHIGAGTSVLTGHGGEVRGLGTQGHPRAGHTAMLLPLGGILQAVLAGSLNGMSRVSINKIPFKGQ